MVKKQLGANNVILNMFINRITSELYFHGNRFNEAGKFLPILRTVQNEALQVEQVAGHSCDPGVCWHL